MALLEVIEGAGYIKHSLATSETQLGRHPDCGLMINSRTVSGIHAKILKLDQDFYIEDLGSLNGTRVNDRPLHKPVKLKHDDRIRVGDVILRFTQEKTVGVEYTSDEQDVTRIRAVMPGDGRSSLSCETQPEAKLKAVLQISSSLAGTVDLSSLLPRILDTLLHIFPQADRACILTRDEVTGEMVSRAIRTRLPGQINNLRLSRTIVTKVLTEKSGVLSADALSDTQFGASQTIFDLSIRSIMCVPMLGLDGEPFGIINIDSQKAGANFTQDDLELLIAVAGQAALSYENTRLAISYVKKKKQDNELAIARNVQHTLLPTAFPEVTGYEFYASYDSAHAVGGDYYDCFAIGSDSVCFTLGDVSGKGVPSALIMTWLSSCVQTTLRFVHEAGAAANAINQQMCNHMVEGRFVTFVLMIIDLQTHEMSLVNAGHMSPLIRTAKGEIQSLGEDVVGPPFGVIDDYAYEVEKYCIDPGDTAVIVTDGVYEARNPAGTFYGMDPIYELVRKGAQGVDGLGKALLADVRSHIDDQTQNDDVTILTFGRTR
ncbi:MAG: SpoIIE family protein phosphatase [Gammaproteobacteria bacterium]|nr:SpoIIE family protein phosphatase [Gammaproteobacteria bacterium]